MIDPHTFAVQMAILAEMHRYDISEVTTAEYYRVLSAEMTTEQFLTACDAIAMDESVYWPKPAAFLAVVRSKPLGVLPGDAWTQVRRLMKGYASPPVSLEQRLEEVAVKVGVAAYRAVQMIGGVERFRGMREDDEAFVMQAFVKAYRDELSDVAAGLQSLGKPKLIGGG